MNKGHQNKTISTTNTIGNVLDESGLNLNAVFDIKQLPPEIQSELTRLFTDLADYRQLILFAHGGTSLWENVRPALPSSEHPIDDYAVKVVTGFFEQQATKPKFKVIYPGQKPVGLQSLGTLAGWHHSSPFKVGINQDWGSWFAYRVAVLADSNLELTSKNEAPSPCTTCASKPCVIACPANALAGEFSLQRCLGYRKAPESLCRDRCLARMACPVGKEHQYELEQIKYHYGISMRMIESLN